MNNRILQQVPVQIPNHLVHFNHGPPLRVHFRTQRLHMRVNHAPLLCPVRADTLASMHIPTFHAIRPHDRRMHQRQHRIDVPRVEQTISGDKGILVAAFRSFAMKLAYRKLAISPSSADLGGRVTDSGSCPSGSSPIFRRSMNVGFLVSM